MGRAYLGFRVACGDFSPYNCLCGPYALPPDPVGTRAMEEIAQCVHVTLSAEWGAL